MRDHFSKFSWAYLLVSKRASEVAEKLVDIFSLFGPPKILQSDNGKEFVATVIKELAKRLERYNHYQWTTKTSTISRMCRKRQW